MGELKELNPIPAGSQPPQQQQQQQQQRIVSLLPISPTSPALSISPISTSPPTSSESGSESGSVSSSIARQHPAEGTSLRRMGSLDRKAATVMARKELVMALYELGMSFLKGWGVQKDKAVAFTYFKIAADLVSAIFLSNSEHFFFLFPEKKDNINDISYFCLFFIQSFRATLTLKTRPHFVITRVSGSKRTCTNPRNITGWQPPRVPLNLGTLGSGNQSTTSTVPPRCLLLPLQSRTRNWP